MESQPSGDSVPLASSSGGPDPLASSSGGPDPLASGPSTSISACGRTGKRHRGEFWGKRYFGLSPSVENLRICLLCEPDKSTTVGAHTGNSTLGRHLQHAHDIERPVATGPVGKAPHNDVSNRSRRPDIDDSTRERQLAALIAWIVDEKRAFSIVESPYFESFLQTLDPRYQLPSRRTLMRSLVDQYHIAREKIQVVLDRIPGRLAITVDGWSSRMMQGCFALTGHWIVLSWRLRRVLVEYSYFPRPHNQLTTSERIIKVLNEYNVASRVRAVTSDNGGEMPPAVARVKDYLKSEMQLDLDDNWHIPHSVRLSYPTQECGGRTRCHTHGNFSVERVCKGHSCIIGSYGHIQGSLRVVWFCQTADTRPESRLRVEVEHNVRHDRPVVHLREDLTKPLTWRVLKSCKDFREDAYNCTKAASGSAYATISMQSLIYKHMKHLCERTAAGRSPCGFTTPAVKRAATAMLTKLTKYEPYMCSKLNLLALLLDPRTSNACDDAKNMKEHLSGTLAANYGYQSAAPPRQEDDVDVAFDLFAEAEGDQAAKDDEVDDFYLMTARADRSCKDILQWWKAHEERFPTISRLARDVFVIQGSSVPCECIFSESGDLIGPDRSSLDPLTVEMHMKLGAWNRLFNEL
ncbi:hypothetical protein PBRA_009126 [Plasmodiophora brassicae]|uniref:HAT C-terminal dimerisation domain-containing protein n=1 Tax=Plasmodiophora brassicae TaxID=37360 RepID=A0A0G4J4U2_PLABS|nr:hypothetical protein PBRA_009126 [Plasmodiophora brassicae]